MDSVRCLFGVVGVQSELLKGVCFHWKVVGEVDVVKRPLWVVSCCGHRSEWTLEGCE